MAANRHISNAGLVLLWPFLEPLFDRLGLTAKGAFTRSASAERGAGLCRSFAGIGPASSGSDDLCKVLCGLPPDLVLAVDFVPSEIEAYEIDRCLHAFALKWEVVAETSLQGIQENFLRRRGELLHDTEGWHLQVDRRAYDSLIDRLPWSIGTIGLPWMTDNIRVDWR